MALHDYTLTPQSVKVHSPTALTFTGHTYIKPYIYLQINMHGVAIKALCIFLDYIKLTNFYLNQFWKAIGSQIPVDYNELFGSMLKIDRW
jgi:hypothetical protein